MTWKQITQDEMELCTKMAWWIRVVRETGGQFYGKDWLPSQADIGKSALFERIRSGREPLEFPPPLGYSCPWYGVVEDPGPHMVGNRIFEHVQFGIAGNEYFPENSVSILQNLYEIVKRLAKEAYLIKDLRHDTPYRWKLWYDPEYDMSRFDNVAQKKPFPPGAWFMQNVDFLKEESK